jgi:hypothetical protein
MATTQGRPRHGDKTVPVLVRFPVTLLARIAAYHGQMASPSWQLTSRHDVILMLCERGLHTVEQGPSPLTPPITGVAGDDGIVEAAVPLTLAETRALFWYCPPFNTALHSLQPLCKHRHEWGTTGRTLKTIKGSSCLECKAESQRQVRKAQASQKKMRHAVARPLAPSPVDGNLSCQNGPLGERSDPAK